MQIRRIIYSHAKFAEPMLDYIIEDFIKSRMRFGDNTIGGMVVCDSSDQAENCLKFLSTNTIPTRKQLKK